jgi:hypothetical protein
MLNYEFEIYRMLGISESVLAVWKNMHSNWKFKGTFVRGMLDAMRLTGQATTALGNLIVN